MKIVQTLWVNDKEDIRAGWLTTKYHLMSWGLSILSFKKYYSSIELVTDEYGSELLIDKLNLPYSSVSQSQETFTSIYKPLWVLRKLYSYSLQNEPFIHVDSDAYLFSPFKSELLNSPLIAQNKEYDHLNYLTGFSEVLRYCNNIPDYFKKDNNGRVSAVNAGIIGGNNYSFFKTLNTECSLFVENNIDKFHQLNIDYLNVIVEQFIFLKLAEHLGQKVTYQFIDEIGANGIYNSFGFDLLPNKIDYIHLMNYKHNHTSCEQMAQRLYIESPELYERIIKVSNELEATKVSMFMENELKTLETFFYRTDLINRHIGLNLNLQITSLNFLTEQINTLPENPNNTILRDAFQFELEKYQFVQSLPSVDDYVQYRKLQSLKVNEILSKSDEEILLSSVTFGEYVTQIESEWKWAEINEFTGQDNAVDYRLNFQQEPSYFQVVLFCYPVSMTVKEQLSDTFTIMIIDVLQQIKSNTLTVQEIMENISEEIYSLNKTNTLEELKANILTKIRYLLYQGILVF